MITLGDVYRIKMNQNDGITPKGNDSYRYKYIIIIGYDGNNYYGAVTSGINIKINAGLFYRKNFK